ncbi:HAD-like domain-containing protein [Xylariales sp. AK1849]|nr:HAD-like domain-containing protein [Xylariales sp. AK1849]
MRTVTVPVLGRPVTFKPKQGRKRKYIVPSRASGGVPNPSIAYTSQAAQSPQQLPKPRNILVVIDLNGTLLHRPNHKNPSRFVERPHARDFLAYCLRTFTVAIWSSAKPLNVQKMLDQLVTAEERAKIVAAWGRDTLGLSKADFNQRVQCYKRLQVLWTDPRVAASHPEARSGKMWDQTNTVLIDDSKEKARTEPYNLIQLPEFEGDAAEEGFVLPQVHDYINECARQVNISAYIRENRFMFKEDFKLGG